jgi:O-antigen/teichoic acid export membrane protein
MIGRKTALAGVLMIAARLITRLFDLVTMLVLARLLVPASFGLVAIASTLVAVAEAALELPVNQAMLHLPHITQRQYDTAFTLSALRGLVLACLVLTAAWPFSYFYNDSRLTLLVCVLSLGPVARGLSSPALAKYQKQMSFWRDFVAELVGKVAGFVAAMYIAMVWESYWALAVGTVIYPMITTLGSYALAPYRPRLTLSEWPVFKGFIGWMSAGQIVSALNWQFERLLLGKLQNTAQLGLFTTASDLSSIPLLAMLAPISRPLLAAFAHMASDRTKLAESYQQANAAVLLISLPLLAGESLVSEPLIRLVLGEKWHAAAPLLQWLAISLIPGMFAVPAFALFMAMGKTQWILRRNLLEFCVKLPLVIVGAVKFGFAGVILARFASEVVTAIYCMRAVQGLVGLPIGRQVSITWRSVASTLTMAVAGAVCLHLLPADGSLPNAALRVGITASVGGTVYVIALAVLWTVAGRPPGMEAFVMAMIGRLTGWGKLRAVSEQ